MDNSTIFKNFRVLTLLGGFTPASPSLASLFPASPKSNSKNDSPFPVKRDKSLQGRSLKALSQPWFCHTAVKLQLNHVTWLNSSLRSV